MNKSDKFTIEDIHQIRYENYEKQKNMTPEELIEDTAKQAEEGKRIIADLKKARFGKNSQAHTSFPC